MGAKGSGGGEVGFGGAFREENIGYEQLQREIPFDDVEGAKANPTLYLGKKNSPNYIAFPLACFGIPFPDASQG